MAGMIWYYTAEVVVVEGTRPHRCFLLLEKRVFHCGTLFTKCVGDGKRLKAAKNGERENCTPTYVFGILDLFSWTTNQCERQKSFRFFLSPLVGFSTIFTSFSLRSHPAPFSFSFLSILLLLLLVRHSKREGGGSGDEISRLPGGESSSSSSSSSSFSSSFSSSSFSSPVA